MPKPKNPLATEFPTPFPADLDSEIQRRTPQVAGLTELSHLQGATITTPLPGHPPTVLPFHPERFTISGGVVQAYLKPAWCFERHVELRDSNGDGGTLLTSPLIHGTNSIHEVPSPPLTLNAAASITYLRWNTNPTGARTSDWNIESWANTATNTHHVPPDPGVANGINGVYFLELWRTNFNAAAASDYVELKWGGHWIHEQALWKGEHPAGDPSPAGSFRPYKDFDEDNNVHRFRVGAEAHGINIVETANTGDIKFFGNNVGTSSTNTGNIYQGDDGTDDARFNILSERPTDVQVSITQATKNSPVIIRGNNKDGSITFRHCDTGNIITSIFWVDGLITTSTDTTVFVTCTNNSNS